MSKHRSRIGGQLAREAPERIRAEAKRRREDPVVGSGIKDSVDLITALRRAAARPRTVQGYVHAGPAMLQEAADQLEKADHE